MPTVKEIEIPADNPCCGNCAAWKQTQGLNGECHLLPPVPMFAGFQQPPQVAGLQLNGRLPPQPIILAAFPAVNANNICRQWSPDQPPLAVEDAPRPKFSYTHAGEGLVEVPDCPLEDASCVLPKGVSEDLDFMDRAARHFEGAKHQDEIPACEHKTLVYRFDRDGKFCEDCGEQILFPNPAR